MLNKTVIPAIQANFK